MKFFVSCLCLLIYVCSQAQDTGSVAATCPSPKSCGRNLNNPIPALTATGAIKTKDYCYAKDCVAPFTGLSNNFGDVSYNNYNACTPHLPDACVKNPGALQYRVFYPSDNIFTYSSACKLPVLIYFHGGGFVDCNGSYLTGDLQTFCTEFAERGFITISVEYRTGVKLPPNGQRDTSYTAQQMLGIWRAAQDARGAIRSIIQRETDGTEPYRIDLANIFVGGNSAGSVAAMTAAYYNIPGLLGSAFPSNISNGNVLGNVNQDFYYGSSSLTYSIKGVLDMWGGILIPQSAVSSLPENFFYQNGNALPPTIAFCGANDHTFEPTSKKLQFVTGTTNANLRSESTCLFDQSGNTTYTVSSSTSYGAILGSQSIYEMLRRKQVYTEFYLDCQMGHGLDDDGTNFRSDFGTGLTTSADVSLYIVKRAATFFQNVMNGKTYNFFPITKFVECPNDRNSCLNNSTTSCTPDSNPTAQVCP